MVVLFLKTAFSISIWKYSDDDLKPADSRKIMCMKSKQHIVNRWVVVITLILSIPGYKHLEPDSNYK